jgi:membrane-bound lytic murein transglycosylase C
MPSRQGILHHCPTWLPLLAVVALAVGAGCETTDRILTRAERTVTSSTGRTILDVAKSKDPESVLKRRGESYARAPESLIRDLRAVKHDFDTLMTALTGNVNRTWGRKEVKLPERTKYVKYTQNYRSRAIVDFDQGEVTVETLDDKDPEGSLKNAIVTTLLTPNDPRSVDLFSDKSVTLTSEGEPYLLGLVQNERGEPIRTPDQAERFAVYLLEKQAGTRAVQVGESQKTARYVRMAMVSNFEHKKAEKYRTVVNQFVRQYKVSPSLVFAIIRTESNFNPFAVSAAPAYGLMQLVPASGGREAYRHAKGADQIPSRDYLFDPGNNIELGSAYLGVLTFTQLEQVANPVSREYCVIAAYNTGPGNVLRTFSKTREIAVNEINELEPGALYDKLRTALPYEETRRYLVSVTGYRKQFVSLPTPSD